jgi:hypothetical protein
VFESSFDAVPDVVFTVQGPIIQEPRCHPFLGQEFVRFHAISVDELDNDLAIR